ncbi:MAG TPA: hypothetical protein VM123_11625 [archaeon]|nr:hypothetical protein [archaeon]
MRFYLSIPGVCPKHHIGARRPGIPYRSYRIDQDLNSRRTSCGKMNEYMIVTLHIPIPVNYVAIQRFIIRAFEKERERFTILDPF